MQKTILHNQSVLDVTLQYTGSMAKLFDLALLNGFSITQELVSGSSCATPSVDDETVFGYFAAKALIPSTAISASDSLPVDPGLLEVIASFGLAEYSQNTTLPLNVNVVLHNQSVFDMTLQHTGSYTKIFDLAIQNGFSITQELEAGSFCKTPSVDDKAIFGHFAAKALIPASAITAFEIDEINRLGIGTMIIETNFIVT